VKRVSLVAAAMPAAVGLVLPAVTANPAIAGTATEGAQSAKSVALDHVRPAAARDGAKPLIASAFRCRGDVCVGVYGSQNHIASASTEVNHHSSNYQETLYLGYQTVHHGDVSNWKHWTGTWSGLNAHTWYPACSFSNNDGAVVSGFGYHHKGSRPEISVFGNNWTGKHPCW
jgi:hypothetical protein